MAILLEQTRFAHNHPPSLSLSLTLTKFQIITFMKKVIFFKEVHVHVSMDTCF